MHIVRDIHAPHRNGHKVNKNPSLPSTPTRRTAVGVYSSPRHEINFKHDFFFSSRPQIQRSDLWIRVHIHVADHVAFVVAEKTQPSDNRIGRVSRFDIAGRIRQSSRSIFRLKTTLNSVSIRS